MAELAVIGKEPFTLGFLLAGVKYVFTDYSLEETKKAIEQLRQNPAIGILVIQQATFDALPLGLQEDLVREVKPVVVTLSEKGEVGKLREMIIKAIGVDLWQE